MINFRVGQHVTWLYVPRGGYGYVIPVDGLVTGIGAARVQIEVKKQGGEMVKRWVKPESLRAKPE